MSETKALLHRLGISQSRLASELSLTPSAVSMKVNAKRPWLAEECAVILKLCRTVDPAVSFEDLGIRREVA